MGMPAEELQLVGLVGGAEFLQDPPSKQARENWHREEEAWAARQPSPSIQRDTAARHDHVDICAMPTRGRVRYPRPPALDATWPPAVMLTAGPSCSSWVSCEAATAGRAGSRHWRSCRWRRGCSAPSCLICRDREVLG